MKKKITVIKFEVVNGKKVGKTLSFDLDPKEMAKYKTENSLRKKIEELVVRSGVFKAADLNYLKYSMKDFLEEWKKQLPIVKAEELARLDMSVNNPGTRITPYRINILAPDEIFVFGSNARGMHHGGAARTACERFGAIMGQGHGLQGKSYAIDSMSGIEAMKKDVEAFVEFARLHKDKRFLVTLIGCGIAGYQPVDVAPLFEECKDLDNVCLPSEFWDIIGLPEVVDQHYDLDRFLNAQARDYDNVVRELSEGRKTSHWIWYIFPQQKGLGHSYNSKYYGLDGQDEARAYLAHPVLGTRLRECCKLLLKHKGKKDIDDIMGSGIDVLKLQTCMNLFKKVSHDEIFGEVLDAFF